MEPNYLENICEGVQFLVKMHATRLQVQTSYKLHEMKKTKTTLNRTQNVLNVTYRLKQILYIV